MSKEEDLEGLCTATYPPAPCTFLVVRTRGCSRAVGSRLTANKRFCDALSTSPQAGCLTRSQSLWIFPRERGNRPENRQPRSGEKIEVMQGADTVRWMHRSSNSFFRTLLGTAS